jgi:hypothetical protein
MFWIGISGPIASGKSTLSQALHVYLQRYNVRVAIIPLARAVRDVAGLETCEEGQRIVALFDLFRSWEYPLSSARAASWAADAAFKTYPSVPGRKNRRLLQTLGIEIGRNILGMDVWIKRVFIAGQDYNIVISDDLRFDNEADIADLHINIDITANEGFYRVNLEQLSVSNEQYGFANHVSEHSLTRRPDFVIPAGFSQAEIASVMNYINVNELVSSPIVL